MKEFSAYCKYCEMVVTGKTNVITDLESGNRLYIGECLICCYEIRRIVARNKIAIDNPNPGSWNGL
jgi:hypothetical protein